MAKVDEVVVQEPEIVLPDSVSSSDDLKAMADAALNPTPAMYLQLLERLNATTARLEAIEKKLEGSAATKLTNPAEATNEESGMEEKEKEDLQDEEDDDDTDNDGKEAEDEEEEEEEAEEEDQPPFSTDDMVKYVPAEKWADDWRNPIWKAREEDEHKEKVGHYLAVSLVPSGPGVARPPENSTAFTPSEPDLKKGRKPDRLAITYVPLLTEVGKICNATVDNTTNVFVRPFRQLLEHYDDFKVSAQENGKKRDKLQAEKIEVVERYEKSIQDAKDKGLDPPRPALPKRLDEKKASSLKKATKLAYGMRCLMHFLDNDMKDIIEVRQAFKDRKLEEIEFEHLWHIFKPGDFVYSLDGKMMQAYRVLHVGGGRPHRVKTDDHGKAVISSKHTKQITDFFIDCFNIDFDGNQYGPAPKTFTIPTYEGFRKLRALEVVPIAGLPDSNEQGIRKKLVERGEKFAELAGVVHKRYNGLSLREGNFRREEVDGDVIIDFALAFKSNMPGYEIEPPNLGGGVIEDATVEKKEETYEVAQNCSTFGHCEVRCTVDDSKFGLRRRSAFLNQYQQIMNKVKRTRDEERLLLLPYRVYGYVLLSRKWYPLDIDLVKPLREKRQDAPDGFDDLVLPPDHKRVVRALVKTHARGPRSATKDRDAKLTVSRDIDLVKGKGKGLIILLHGVPGVGKTSTAECVAENTNRPLFPITCGDIGGTTAREVEKNLESYFDLARKWGCVLLLDEADVFLGERTKGDIVQNSLVSVFLRVLEYYSGILILTTNRVGQFDEAIKSRIHISLYYAPLNKSDTLKIWNMNLKRLEREYEKSGEEETGSSRRPALPVRFNKKEIKEFAKGHWKTCKANGIHWNGRQIKNAFQTAIALAEWDALERREEGQKVDMILLQTKHFKDVAETSARFDHYLAQLRKTDAEKAKLDQIRDDYFEDLGSKTEFGIQYPNRQDLKAQKLRMRTAKRAALEPDPDEDSSDSSPDSESEEEVKPKPKDLGKGKRGRERREPRLEAEPVGKESGKARKSRRGPEEPPSRKKGAKLPSESGSSSGIDDYSEENSE